MIIKGWIQSSDYSSSELGLVSFEQAAEAILSFSWVKRLQEYADRLLHKNDACPPGIGFNSDKKGVFHVYAVAIDQWQVYVRLCRPKKILGIFPMPLRTLHGEVKSLERTIELLRLFFDGDHERLAAEIEKIPSREAVVPILG